MSTSTFSYAAPATLPEALALLAQAGHELLPAGPALAGQADLAGRTLISLRRVADLRIITADADQLVIGATATYADLLQADALAHLPALAQALATLPDAHQRHHSTLGGALHHGGPAHAPVLAALLALDATVHVLGATGSATMPLAQWLTESSALTAVGSLATQVLLPIEGGLASHYLALAQPLGYYTSQGVAVAGRLADGRVAEVRVALAGFTAQPQRLPGVEAALQGHLLNEPGLLAAAAEELHLAEADDPAAGYHQHVAKVLVRRCLTDLFAALHAA